MALFKRKHQAPANSSIYTVIILSIAVFILEFVLIVFESRPNHILAQTNPDLASFYKDVFSQTETSENSDSGTLGKLTLLGPPLDQDPVNTQGSILIPKINVNSPIEFDVAVNDKEAYLKALETGVAHAAGTSKPTTENNNTYLFAHSTADERNIAQYAAVFTKLNELETGDSITLFYQNRRFDYKLFRQEIVPSFEVSVLKRSYPHPSLTLQTCDPPGEAINRLILTAELLGVYDN